MSGHPHDATGQCSAVSVHPRSKRSAMRALEPSSGATMTRARDRARAIARGCEELVSESTPRLRGMRAFAALAAAIAALSLVRGRREPYDHQVRARDARVVVERRVSLNRGGLVTNFSYAHRRARTRRDSRPPGAAARQSKRSFPRIPARAFSRGSSRRRTRPSMS